MQYGPGSAATFLYYFTSTALVFTLVTATATHTSVNGLPQQVGLLGGLVGGLIGAYFNRTVTLTLETTGNDAHFKTLVQSLEAMGYTQQREAEGILVYERHGLSKLASGKFFVHPEGEKVTVASRAIHMQALKRLL